MIPKPLPAPPPRPSFAEVYEAELDYLWRSIRRLGARSGDVEDLVHDVFLVVHRRLADYDQSRPLRPWLFGIALRVVMGQRRKRRETLVEDPEVVDESPDVQAHLEAREAQGLLTSALALMPIDQRAVVILHDVDEQAAPTIAAALEIPLNTVYSRLRLGRAKLATAVRRLREGGGETP